MSDKFPQSTTSSIPTKEVISDSDSEGFLLATDDLPADEGEISSVELNKGLDILVAGLRANPTHSISTMALKKNLQEAGFEDAKVDQIVTTIKFSRSEHDSVRFVRKGRSFLTEDAAKNLEQEMLHQAKETVEETTNDVRFSESEEHPKTRAYKQDEAILVKFVTEALEAIYEPEHDLSSQYTFDTHSERSGGEFENVDILAIHWRTEDIAEIVSVEAKLKFSAALLQQANNYKRFSDRVWVAVPVDAEAGMEATKLREQDILLFDLAVQSGIGILACRKVRRKYEVTPIHWPSPCSVSRVDRSAFLKRRKEKFIEAGVIPPESKKRYASWS